MARIRTIKPDFFLNDELASLCALDRILFIGLWTQADREGRLEDRPMRIKAAILPYDDYDVDTALSRLQEKKFINRYENKTCKYIEIINFSRHQYPNIKEPESTIPAPYQHHTGTSRLRKGKEGKGREGNNICPSSQDFLDSWNDKVKNTPLPQAKELSKGRTAKIKVRLSERTLPEWQKIFELITQSKFCRGENDKGWKADLDWIIANDTNAAKVLEGKYADRAGPRHGGVTEHNLGVLRDLHGGEHGQQAGANERAEGQGEKNKVRQSSALPRNNDASKA